VLKGFILPVITIAALGLMFAGVRGRYLTKAAAVAVMLLTLILPRFSPTMWTVAVVAQMGLIVVALVLVAVDRVT
jgi:hypothetical protein